MVVSVAPPKLITSVCGKTVRTSSGMERAIQSPARNTTRIVSRPGPVASVLVRNGSTQASSGGAEFQAVIGSASRMSASRAGSTSSASLASRTDPPTASRPKTS